MSTEALRGAIGETYKEKALRKFKKEPLVPLGALILSRKGVRDGLLQ